MLASLSYPHRKVKLEGIIRQSLSTGILSHQASQTIQTIRSQPDLTRDEIRILEILQDSLQCGAVKQAFND